MKRALTFSIIICFIGTLSLAQKVTLKIEPNPIVITVGETAKPNVTAYDADGNKLQDSPLTWQIFGASVLRFEGMVPSSGAEIDSLGNITGKIPGTYNSAIIRPGGEDQPFAMEYIVIEITNCASC